MRVFVTGGNGFIGSRVVRLLADRGDEVLCLLRPTSRTDRIDDVSFERIDGDVRNADSVRTAMGRADCTIHLAAPGGWSADDPRVLDDVIVGGTGNVLAAAEQMAGHRVVFVSSTAAIDASNKPRVFDEASAFTIRDPHLAYAHAKHHAELRVVAAVERGADVVIVNPSEVYGPNDTALGTAGNLIEMATSRPVLVCPGGTSVVHVDDVAAGILGALEWGQTGERYILGGDNITIPDLARLVLDVLGRRAPIVTIPGGIARAAARAATGLGVKFPYDPSVVAYATRYWFVDNAKARRELGVTFRGARETIAPTLEWLQREGLLEKQTTE